jgi:hypothetical protein
VNIMIVFLKLIYQAMTNPIALCTGLVKCDQINIRAILIFWKKTLCVIRVLVRFWIPNCWLVHLKIICQTLFIINTILTITVHHVEDCKISVGIHGDKLIQTRLSLTASSSGFLIADCFLLGSHYSPKNISNTI